MAEDDWCTGCPLVDEDDKGKYCEVYAEYYPDKDLNYHATICKKKVGDKHGAWKIQYTRTLVCPFCGTKDPESNPDPQKARDSVWFCSCCGAHLKGIDQSTEFIASTSNPIQERG